MIDLDREQQQTMDEKAKGRMRFYGHPTKQVVEHEYKLGFRDGAQCVINQIGKLVEEQEDE